MGRGTFTSRSEYGPDHMMRNAVSGCCDPMKGSALEARTWRHQGTRHCLGDHRFSSWPVARHAIGGSVATEGFDGFVGTSDASGPDVYPCGASGGYRASEAGP